MEKFYVYVIRQKKKLSTYPVFNLVSCYNENFSVSPICSRWLSNNFEGKHQLQFLPCAFSLEIKLTRHSLLWCEKSAENWRDLSDSPRIVRKLRFRSDRQNPSASRSCKKKKNENNTMFDANINKAQPESHDIRKDTDVFAAMEKSHAYVKRLLRNSIHSSCFSCSSRSWSNSINNFPRSTWKKHAGQRVNITFAWQYFYNYIPSN